MNLFSSRTKRIVILTAKRMTINRPGFASRGTIRIMTAKIGAQIETTSSRGLSHAR